MSKVCTVAIPGLLHVFVMLISILRVALDNPLHSNFLSSPRNLGQLSKELQAPSREGLGNASRAHVFKDFAQNDRK